MPKKPKTTHPTGTEVSNMARTFNEHFESHHQVSTTNDNTINSLEKSIQVISLEFEDLKNKIKLLTEKNENLENQLNSNLNENFKKLDDDINNLRSKLNNCISDIEVINKKIKDSKNNNEETASTTEYNDLLLLNQIINFLFSETESEVLENIINPMILAVTIVEPKLFQDLIPISNNKIASRIFYTFIGYSVCKIIYSHASGKQTRKQCFTKIIVKVASIGIAISTGKIFEFFARKTFDADAGSVGCLVGTTVGFFAFNKLTKKF